MHTHSIGRAGFRAVRRLAIVATVMVPIVAAQAASVVVGNHYLLPNTPNQLITIQVVGGEQIAGEDFYAQIGDGGTFNSGTNTKPVFANVDIIGGTIFAGNNNGAFGDPGGEGAHPLIWGDGTTTASGTVSANGLLATLNIDTTGLNSGSFPLLLSGVANNHGSFNTTLRNANGSPISLTISNGTLTLWSAPYGDYNQDGSVNAADYVQWRNTDGAPAGYNVWRSNFEVGNGAAADPLSPGSVPEPTSIWMLTLGAAIGATMGPRVVSRARTR